MMNRYTPVIITVFLCIITPAHATFELVPAGARPLGMAGAYIAVADDAHSPFLNPAGMSQLRYTELTSYYTMLFGLKELTQMVLSGVVSTPAGHLGLFYRSFGGPLYRESAVGVAWSHTLGSRLMAGSAVRMLTLSVKGYGAARTASLDAGLLVFLPYQTRLGMTVHNINRLKLASQRDDSPRRTSIGVSRSSHRLTVAFQIDHETRYGTTTRIGQEFHPIKPISIRAGLTTSPTLVFVGLGMQINRMVTEYALSSHPVLGSSHHVSLSFRFE